MKLFVDAAWESLLHYGEELCGDKVEIVRGDGYFILVLADGLGSGVKANILATLTSKIIATMLSKGSELSEVVETIASTLPVCSERGIAYSTFTIIRITDDGNIYIAEFDNPSAVFFRNNKILELDRKENIICDKQIFITELQAIPNDIIVTFSDGVVHAGVGKLLDLGWQYNNAIKYLAESLNNNTSPRMLVKKLIGSVNTLYMDEPGDDSTVCALKLKQNIPCTVMVGPPVDKEMDNIVVGRLISSQGKKVVCGGTTSQIVERVTGHELTVELDYDNPQIPPTAHIKGIDLVTEGVLTIGKAIEYIKQYTDDANHDSAFLLHKTDAAAQLVKLLLEESTEVNFLVGRALNPAHQNPGMPVSLGLKLNLIKDLASELERAGKKVTMEFF